MVNKFLKFNSILFLVFLTFTLFSNANTSAYAERSIYKFSFEDGKSLSVEKFSNKYFTFKICEGGGCEQLGRVEGYSLRELNRAKLKLNIKRGALNLGLGTLTACSTVLGAGAGISIPFGVSELIPFESLKMVAIFLSWAAMPLTSVSGTYIGFSSGVLFGGAVRNEISLSSMDGAAEVLASVQPFERVSYWRQMKRWISPALNQNIESENPTIVIYKVDPLINSDEVIKSLTYLFKTIEN